MHTLWYEYGQHIHQLYTTPAPRPFRTVPRPVRDYNQDGMGVLATHAHFQAPLSLHFYIYWLFISFSHVINGPPHWQIHKDITKKHQLLRISFSTLSIVG